MPSKDRFGFYDLTVLGTVYEFRSDAEKAREALESTLKLLDGRCSVSIAAVQSVVGPPKSIWSYEI